MTTPEKPWYSSIVAAFLVRDCAELLAVNPATFSRDVKTCENRLTAEGESFLTKTLPAFGKIFDLALQERTPFVQTYFKKVGRGCVLPKFLIGLTRRVFNEKGEVLQHPCTTSITLIRQLCFWFKKLEKGFSDESLQLATSDLEKVDADLPDRDTLRVNRNLVRAKGLLRILFRKLDIRNLAFRHGPGAVAGGENVVEKRKMKRAYRNLERVFRPIPTFFSLRTASENPQAIYGREHIEYGISRIAFVEKDSSGPRDRKSVV